MEKLNSLIELAKKKSNIDCTSNWSKSGEIFFEEIQKETLEAHKEYIDNKQVYLEDELGDILWDYINLLVNLEKHQKIESIDKILQRANKKYSERINAIQNNTTWDKIKEKQKKELKAEQLLLKK